MALGYLSLEAIDRHLSRMRALGVSKVARSSRGFLAAYRRAGGDPDRLSDRWDARRDAFIRRHMAQVRLRGESIWRDGQPTRRHLALIAWAYSPTAARL